MIVVTAQAPQYCPYQVGYLSCKGGRRMPSGRLRLDLEMLLGVESDIIGTALDWLVAGAVCEERKKARLVKRVERMKETLARYTQVLQEEDLTG